MRKLECFGHALGAGTLIETSACSALSRNCALAQLRTGAPALCFPSFFQPQCGGPCAVALVCVFSSVISLDPDKTRVHGSREKLDHTDSRACVAHFSYLVVQTSGAMDQLDRSFSLFSAWPMERLSTVYGERSRSRSVVHAKLLRRDQQHQVQPRRTDVEGSQTRHL